MVKLYIESMKLKLKSQLEYRLSFILTFISQIGVFCTYYFMTVALFQRFDNIKGFTLYEVLLCFSIIHFGFAFNETFFRGVDKFDKFIIEEANKGKACLENNIDIFVDDSLKHLNRIYDAGIKKIYIFDNVYNRENNKYNRIYSFRDLYYNVIG